MFTMLPSATGPYKVGLSSFVRDLPPQSIGNAKLGDGSTVLDMDAVVWNVFYPCDARAATYGSAWIDQSYKASVSGISKFTGLSKLAVGPVIWLYGMRLQMPVYQNASLLQHEDGRPWRLVIFSHGLAGSKTMYSQFCSELASQGLVVLAVEHRDRSGMLVTSRAGDHMLYVAPSELNWDQPDTTEFLFRVEQLEFRRLEVYEIFKAFRDVVSGDATGVHHLNGGPIDATVWRGRVQCDKDVVLAGHSFGGCTMLSVLSNPPPRTHDPLPLSHALALDPWFQPLSTPGPMPSSFNTNIPLCMMFSERFALWKDHHATAKALVDSWPAKASMFALPKCSHETFSDVYCIVPFSGKTLGVIFRTIMDISHSFLEDRLDAEVDQRQSVPWNIISEKKKDTTIRRLDGVAGSIVIP